MTNEELLREFSSLPTDVKSQIERIIERFKSEQTSEAKKKSTATRRTVLRNVGRSRGYEKDPVTWVRHIRETQWNKPRR